MLLHNGYRRIPQTPGNPLHRTDGCLVPATIAAALNQEIGRNLQARADEWGLNITSTAITEVEVDDETKKAQRQQLNAERERRAAIARAEGDKRAVELAAEYLLGGVECH